MIFISITFPQLLNNLLAYLAHILTLVPAGEIVKEQQLFILQSDRRYNVVVHHVRNEVLRQAFTVYDFLSRLFEVFHKIGNRPSKHGIIFYLLKIRTPESFVEIGILHRDLSAATFEAVIAFFNQQPRHRSLGDIEQPVKMQTLFFGRTFPYVHILPAFPRSKICKRLFQALLKTFLGMKLSVVGKRYKMGKRL